MAILSCMNPNYDVLKLVFTTLILRNTFLMIPENTRSVGDSIHMYVCTNGGTNKTWSIVGHVFAMIRNVGAFVVALWT